MTALTLDFVGQGRGAVGPGSVWQEGRRWYTSRKEEEERGCDGRVRKTIKDLEKISSGSTGPLSGITSTQDGKREVR